MSTRLHLRTWGQVGLEDADGRQLSLSQQQLVLLGLLAASSSMTRTQVQSLLWPERAARQASHSLSQTIYAINRRCGELVAQPASGSLSLNRLALTTDVECAPKAGFSEAGPLDDLSFLASLAGYPSDTFDEWRRHADTVLRGRFAVAEATSHAEAETAEPEQSSTQIFLGRKTELEVVRRLWENVKKGATSVVVISGESGIGKSHFCRRVLRVVAVLGGTTHSVHCSKSDDATQYTIPKKLITGGRAPSPMGNDVAQDFIEALSRQTVSPTCIVIEDAHNIDDGSARWLESLLRVADDWPLMILLSVNTDDRVDRDRAIKLMTSAGVSATWLDLRGLDYLDAVALVDHEESRGSTRMSAKLKEHIIKISRGHPLFLIELAREALLRQAAETYDGGLLEQLYTPTLDAILRRRLSRVGQDGERAAAALAVLGPCSAAELASLLNVDPDECAHALNALNGLGMLTAEGSNIDLNHELLRVAASKSIPPHERAALHSKCARLILGRKPDDLTTAARHYYAAGCLDLAYKCAVRAALNAYAANALTAALRNLAVAEMAALNDEHLVSVLVERARILCSLGQFDDARDTLERVEGLFGPDNRLGVDLLILARTITALEAGRLPASLVLQRLEPLVGSIKASGDDRLLVCIVKYILTAAHDSGHEVVVKWIVSSVSSGSLGPVSEANAQLYVSAANAEVVYGSAAEAHRLLDMVANTGALRSVSVEATYLTVRGIVLLVEGRLSEAQEQLEMAARKSMHASTPGTRERILTNLAVVRMEMGDWDGAHDTLQRALGTASAHERLAVLANQAAWCLHVGRFDILAEVLHELEHANSVLRVRWADTAFETFRALWYLHHGYVNRATEIANALAVDLAEDRRDLTDRSYSEIAIARAWTAVGRREAAVERLRLIEEQMPGTQWSGRLRLKAELAALLRPLSPSEAKALASSVRIEARSKGAYAHIRQLAV